MLSRPTSGSAACEGRRHRPWRGPFAETVCLDATSSRDCTIFRGMKKVSEILEKIDGPFGAPNVRSLAADEDGRAR
jgi:hypothetical protein